VSAHADGQAAFAAALRAPGLAPPDELASRSQGLVRRRFDIHRNNMMSSLIEALAAAFPAVRNLVGNAYFRAAARAYVAEQPPRSPVLANYGDTFADFLERLPAAAGVPYLGDVARLEWARLRAYHAADATPIGIAALGNVPAEQVDAIVFTFHPSAALVRSRFPVVTLWSATTGPGSDRAPDMRKAEDAFVVRPGLAVDTRILPIGAADFITALMDGASLADAAARASAASTGFDLAKHLGGLVATGAITGLGSDPERPRP
jgi:Putative DNA-binding domain